LVAQVLKGSPGEQAGLQAGDVILSFNGKSVPTSSALPPLVGVSPVGEPAKVEVLRRGKLREIEVMIGELPEDEEIVRTGPVPSEPQSPNRIGLIVGDLSAEEREQLGVEQGGVLVEGIESGPAERAGVRTGDVILMLDNQPVDGTKQFRELLDRLEPGRSVAALVQRGDGRMFFAIRIPRE